MRHFMTTILCTVLILSGCQSGPSLEEVRSDYEIQLSALEDQLESKNLKITELEDNQSVLGNSIQSKDVQISELKAELEEAKDNLSALEGAMSDLEVAQNKSNQTPTVVQVSQTVIDLIKNQDFQNLASYAHPTSGVRFTPYPYVNVGSDLIFNGPQIAAFSSDSTVYTWGAYDGSGEPIEMMPMDYYNNFIYDADFALPEMLSWNSPIGTGNMINNLTSVYPTADYVEYHFTGFDSQYDGMDWVSLTLVFENVAGDWYLVGIVHGQWTT